MTTKIRLRNGWEFDATPLPGDLFEITLSNGRRKTYALDAITVIESGADEEEVFISTEMEPYNKEGGKKMIYHYLWENSWTPSVEGENSTKVMVRVITTTPIPAHRDAYAKSLEHKMPYNDVYALSTGSWHFPLLEDRLVAKGKDFTMMIVENKNLAFIPNADFLARANFAWANASYTFYLRVDGQVGYGLDSFGISIKMAKKSSKRLMEIPRMAEMSLHLEGDEEMNTVSFNFPDLAGDPIFYDGMTYVSRRFMHRLAEGCPDPKRRAKLHYQISSGKLVRVVIRGLTEYGELKGDAIVVPTKQLNGHDIVTVQDNLKSELMVDGFSHFTAWEHAPMHAAVHDVQSFEGFQEAFTSHQWIADIWNFVARMEKANITGEIPQFLLLGEIAHNDDGTPDLERLSATLSKTWMRWQLAGRNVSALQNAMYMALNGAFKRMDTPKQYGFHKKMWTPMTNAALMAVVTWESATRVGNFTFPNKRKDEVFYDPRVGLVIPGNRFVETYNLHGGWDLDDSVKVVLVKVWTSDPDIVALHRNKTIPADAIIANDPSKARIMALLVRSPNGPGEYSIEKVDIDSIEIPDELRRSDISFIDLAKMPLPQDVLINNTTCRGLTFSTVYSNQEMTIGDSMTMIDAQTLNPGIGQFCNAMMVWQAETGGKSFPPKMLDRMENIVDTSQQGFDVSAFLEIGSEPDNILEQLSAVVGAIDTALAKTRMNHIQAAKFKLYRGRLTEVHSEYEKAMVYLREKVINYTLQIRATTPEVQMIRRELFPMEYLNWAETFHTTYLSRLSIIDATFDADGEENPFRRMQIQHYHKVEMERVVAEMVSVFENIEDEEMRYRLIKALWKVIVTPTQSSPLGRSDRILVQPGATGTKALLDILIEALS